jgi:bacterial/archaeal transporter family-2 protein
VAGTLGAFGALADADPAHLWGGLGSAAYITAGILLFPRLGALVAVGLFIAGQMGASLLLDASGWLGVEREPLGVSAVAGALAVVVGTWMIVRVQAGADSLDTALRNRRGWIGVGLAAGAALPVQGAVNAQLRAEVDAPITVGAFSFLVATVTMAVVLTVLLAATRSARPTAGRLGTVPWWGWLGGACGATYVTAVFVLIPEIGVAPTVALTVAGQQIASVFVDRYGLLRLPRRPISRPRLTGVVALLIGVALIQLA